MLNVKNNRLNYGELLTPPVGYKLIKAVGTTYSLDLYALLALPVAMIYSKNLDGDFSQNRYDVLDAIRRSKDKIEIFCQRGKIHVPEKYNSLLAFMEDSIIEITPSAFNSSFHPKIWVLKYGNKEGVLYRVIVLSRNLTFDRSWDVALFCEGKPRETVNKNSSKLSEYLKYIYNHAEREYDEEFLRELSKVEFNNPDYFSQLNFFPILNYQGSKTIFPHPLLNKNFDELLIISPFVDNKTIQNLKGQSSKITLISRQEELDLLNPAVLKNVDVYCLNPLVVSREDDFNEPNDLPSNQNLHAKIFIGRKNLKTEWFLGSANCTSPAFDRNAEFLVNVISNHKNTELKSLKKILLDDQSNLFQKYWPNEQKPQEEQKKLELLLREITHIIGKGIYKGKVLTNPNNENFDIALETLTEAISNKDFNITISLIHRKDQESPIQFGGKESFVFSNIALVNLSEFLIFSIYYKKEKQSRIALKMEIDIPEERENIIFQNLINNKIKFYQYLQFLLSPEDFTESMFIDEELSDKKIGKAANENSLQLYAPVYENLLLAASRNPEKLKEVNNIVERLEKIDSEIVQDFKPIWKVFKEFAYVDGN